MFKKRPLPPPTDFTARDGVQILFGVAMIPLGLAMLYNTFTRGAAVPALLIGGAFVAFGLYRTLFAWSRVRWYLELRRGERHD